MALTVDAEVLGKICFVGSLYTTHSTWTGLVLNPHLPTGRRGTSHRNDRIVFDFSVQ